MKAKNFSRSKGIRNEYILRDYLRERGYEANRVPLSGASQGYKFDVVATKAGMQYTFEMKARQSEFKCFYDFYFHYCILGTLRFSHSTLGVISISTDFEETRKPNAWFPLTQFEGKYALSARKLVLMNKLRQGADFLVVRGARQPMLFIKFWEEPHEARAVPQA